MGVAQPLETSVRPDIRRTTHPDNAPPTIWGLDPLQLHDRFWAARGVQVVRQGETGPIREGAELYLLTDPGTLLLFSTRHFVDLLSWAKPDLLSLRIRNERNRGFQERAANDANGAFAHFERSYGGSDSRLARVALTSDFGLARLWQRASGSLQGWRQLRRHTKRQSREVRSLTARAYDRTSQADQARFMRDVIQIWKHPAATIEGIRRVASNVWALSDMSVSSDARIAGPVWVGAGRQIGGIGVFGPSALWDDPAVSTISSTPNWREIEPLSSSLAATRVASPAGHYRSFKRLFDILFSLIALTITLPLFPLVALAIWLEDGRPFFFSHRRETIGGSTFQCWKFRSMRKNADQIKSTLAGVNQADGPQFYIQSDPRLTRVGRVLRRCNIDELPQFLNVLRGEMSVVGPRPSPRDENQYCPPWRDARLSVRPGITGLWQVRRTRTAGLDFQEWIRFDIEYVVKMGWRLDAEILLRTVVYLLKGALKS